MKTGNCTSAITTWFYTGENSMKFLLALIFVLLTVAAVRYYLEERRQKIINRGLQVTTLLIAAGNLMCIIYVFVRSSVATGHVLLIYYLIHAWLMTAVFWMIILTESKSPKYKEMQKYLKYSVVISVAQTLMIAAGLVGFEVFEFKKKLFWIKTWYVAFNPEGAGYFLNYNSYIILIFLNMLIMLAISVTSLFLCPRLFRSRYGIFAGIAVGLALIELVAVLLRLPVWVQSIPYNCIYVVCMYLTGDYAKNRIRDWSLDNFADNMGDGLILYDSSNNLLHINAMIRKSIHAELVREFEDRDKLEEWLSHTVEMDNSRVLTYEGPDRVYYFVPYTNELRDKGMLIGTLYILHDHSDSFNRIRSMWKANEELEKAGRMKSDFLANMSHEIRTPMNAVIGMAEIAMRENDPERVNDYLRQIQSSGKNLLNIINDILDYSKIESGKMEIIEDEYIPFEELSETGNVLAVRVAGKPVELFILVEGGMPHKLIGDAMRIRQVLINLANNAIKFTNQGAVKIQLTCEKLNDNYVNLTYHVIDTGIGIKQEDLGKLFDSFQQVDSKRNRSVEGTGLGLAISRRLVSAMSGTMGVESEYGKGSDFWFSIPQKIADETNDLVVEEADTKRAYVLNDDAVMAQEFINEVERLGVQGRVVHDPGETELTADKEFLFFELSDYNDGIRSFLSSHPDVRGIVLTGIDDEVREDLPNLHVMRKPETTMNMVRILNERYDETVTSDDSNMFVVDYTAPDAKVLVVDDNDINLTIAGGLLDSMDIVPDYAHGGREAIDMAIANNYDIVFMDHMMPEIDGVEATITIRKELNSMIHPVIIALSANVMEEARKLFKSSGMNDFVAKPIDIKILAEKVRKWLPEEKIIEKSSDELLSEHHDGCVAEQIVYSGLDTAGALKALGSPKLYDKILEEYYSSGSDKYEGIRQAYANEDWADYTIRVHALKSSSRQVGAMALGDMAEQLEKAGKASDIDTIRSKTDETLGEYRRFLDALDTYYKVAHSDDDEADKPLIDRDTLHDITSGLAAACEELDMDQMEAASDRLKAYSYDEAMRPLIDELLKAISNMDTEKCEELIGQL